MTTRLQWPLRCLLTGLLMGLPSADVTAQVRLDDAERFARLMTQTADRPSERELQRDVIAQATPELRGLLAREGVDSVALQSALDAQRYAYRHAIELCLPAMRRIAGQVGSWLSMPADVADAVADQGVVAVFGAGTTGGTVQDGRIVIALEVQCRFADTPASAELALESAIRHEAVHVHQLQRQKAGAENSLLRQALIEGVADWVSTRQLGRVPPQAIARSTYGSAHEARLWQEFSADMHGPYLGQWMYGPGRSGEPADLGYWLGSQIVAAYMQQAEAQGPALEKLLMLESPEEILQASGYNPIVPAVSVLPGSINP